MRAEAGDFGGGAEAQKRFPPPEDENASDIFGDDFWVEVAEGVAEAEATGAPRKATPQLEITGSFQEQRQKEIRMGDRDEMRRTLSFMTLNDIRSAPDPDQAYALYQYANEVGAISHKDLADPKLFEKVKAGYEKMPERPKKNELAVEEVLNDVLTTPDPISAYEVFEHARQLGDVSQRDLKDHPKLFAKVERGFIENMYKKRDAKKGEPTEPAVNGEEEVQAEAA